MFLGFSSDKCTYTDLLQSLRLRIWSTGYTQKYVADSLSIDPGTFSKVLNGVIVPSARTMLRICVFVNKLPVKL